MFEVINQQENLRTFGQIVRLLRTHNNYALRDLAQKSHVSHTYLSKIESGEVILTLTIFENICNVFNIKLIEDKVLDEKLERYQSKIYQYIVNFGKETIRHYMEELERHEKYYKTSLKMIDYYLLKIGVYNHLVYGELMDIAPLINDFDKLLPLLLPYQQQQFLTYSGVFHYNQKDFDEAIERFIKAYQCDVTNELAPLNLYLVGRALSETFKLSLALRYLEDASKGFEKYHNYERLMHCKTLVYINKMKLGILENAEERFDEVSLYSERSNLRYIQQMVEYNRVIYFLTTEQYDKALKNLETIKVKNTRYYFYKAVAYMKLNEKTKVLQTIESLDISGDTQKSKMTLYYRGIDYIKSYFIDLGYNDEAYEFHLKRFYQEILLVEAYIELRFLYHYYLDYLKSKRRYKEAYYLSKKMIEVSQITIQ